MRTSSRRPLAKISMFGITYMNRQNPYMVAWWSAVFPGFGHFLLNKYYRATLMTLFEVVINTLAHINEAMIYSFCGQFELAKSIIQPRWMLGYIVIYLFSIWDSYRSALFQNKLCHLAELENGPLPSLKVFSTEIQYLEPRQPGIGVWYSFLFPGLGQLYNHRIGLAFYAIFWWWIYVGLSRFYESCLYLMLGRLSDSIVILHPHWLLFLPSVMGGSIYHSYVTSIDHNRLYRLEQRQYLTNQYKHSEVRIFDKAGVNPC